MNTSVRITWCVMVAVMVLLAGTLRAQRSSTATATSTATIVDAPTLTKEADLRFSGIVLCPGGGTSTVDFVSNHSTQTFSAGLVHHDVFDTWSAARFKVQGTPLRYYNVTLPASVLIYKGSDVMTVDNLNVRYESGSTAHRLKAVGTQLFYIGGTLHIAAGQASGFYYGTFDVSVAYN